jgi:hypothetical protein
VDLLGGLGARLEPSPGRIFIVGPSHSFSGLADAINAGFARWDLSHLHEFELADGRQIGFVDPEPLFGDGAAVEDHASVKVARAVAPGEAFGFVFDFGDRWEHRCRVLDEKVDPRQEWGDGPLPREPVAIWAGERSPTSTDAGRRPSSISARDGQPAMSRRSQTTTSAERHEPQVQAVVALVAGAAHELGRRGAAGRLTPEHVRAHDASPVLRRGVVAPDGATVHPGLPALGPVCSRGGALARLGVLRGRVFAGSSHLIVTEPVPEVIEEPGWGGEAVSGARAFPAPHRTTGARAPACRWTRRSSRRCERPVHAAAGDVGTASGPRTWSGGSSPRRRSDAAIPEAAVPAGGWIPPEPQRWAGAHAVRAALLRTKDTDEEGRRAGLPARTPASAPRRLGITVGR